MDVTPTLESLPRTLATIAAATALLVLAAQAGGMRLRSASRRRSLWFAVFATTGLLVAGLSTGIAPAVGELSLTGLRGLARTSAARLSSQATSPALPKTASPIHSASDAPPAGEPVERLETTSPVGPGEPISPHSFLVPAPVVLPLSAPEIDVSVGTAGELEPTTATAATAATATTSEPAQRGAASSPETPGAPTPRSAAPTVPFPGIETFALRISAVVAAVWLAGTLLALVLWLRAQLRLRRLRHGLEPVEDPHLLDRLSRIATTLGVRKPVEIARGNVRAPLTFGCRRPVIVVPPGFSHAHETAEQDVLLAHELAHVAQGDAAATVWVDGVTAVLWWHPAIWWARRRFRLECEHAADSAAAVLEGGQRKLARCLVRLGRRLTLTPASPGFSAGGEPFRSALGRRVEHLLDDSAPRWRAPRPRARAVWQTATATLLTVSITLGTTWALPASEQAGDRTMQTTARHHWRRSMAGWIAGTLFLVTATTASGETGEGSKDDGASGSSPVAVEDPAEGGTEDLDLFASREDEPEAATTAAPKPAGTARVPAGDDSMVPARQETPDDLLRPRPSRPESHPLPSLPRNAATPSDPTLPPPVARPTPRSTDEGAAPAPAQPRPMNVPGADDIGAIRPDPTRPDAGRPADSGGFPVARPTPGGASSPGAEPMQDDATSRGSPGSPFAPPRLDNNSAGRPASFGKDMFGSARNESEATTPSAGAGGLSLDIVQLAMALTESIGEVELARVQAEIAAQKARVGNVPSEEAILARIRRETAERKVALLQRMIQSALASQESLLVELVNQQERVNALHKQGAISSVEVSRARALVARQRGNVDILRVVLAESAVAKKPQVPQAARGAIRELGNNRWRVDLSGADPEAVLDGLEQTFAPLPEAARKDLELEIVFDAEQKSSVVTTAFERLSRLGIVKLKLRARPSTSSQESSFDFGGSNLPEERSDAGIGFDAETDAEKDMGADTGSESTPKR